MSTGRPIDDLGHIVLVRHDPAWTDEYEAVRRRLAHALGDRLVTVDHVGSTSVPGLAAKPVIDVVATVEDPDDEDAYAPALAAVGFTVAVREPDWYAHRCLKSTDPWVNLHVFPVGCPEVDRMRWFRDRLRARPDERARYEATKVALAERQWDEVQDYADAKNEVVAAIMGSWPGEDRT